MNWYTDLKERFHTHHKSGTQPEQYVLTFEGQPKRYILAMDDMEAAYVAQDLADQHKWTLTDIERDTDA